MGVVVATEQGTDDLPGRDVSALVAGTDRTMWAVVDGTELWRRGDRWARVARWTGPSLTCVWAGVGPDDVVVGTEEAHVVRLDGDELVPWTSFDDAPGRARWHTPWGGPPDTRSIAGRDDAVLVNVHVGGVVRSDDGETWHPLVDIDVDVHQVVVAPDASVLVATGAAGFGRSTDGGATWRWDHGGLHGSYCRAVAMAGEFVLLSASTGPGHTRGAVYRRGLGQAGSWERVTELVDGNVDTFWLDASPDLAAFVTDDGSLWTSADDGATWERATGPSARPRAVLVT